MKYLLLTSLFSVAFSIAVSAQPATAPTPVCSNETVEKISTRGVKIGMKIEDILSLFATDEVDKVRLRRANGDNQKYLGYEAFRANPLPIDAKPDGRFEGIHFYSFNFLDEKLTGFQVLYSKPNWKDSKQFAETMIKALNLPSIDKWEDNGGRLYCGDYKIMLSSSGSFSVGDERIKKIVDDRKAKIEDDQRIADIKKFKP